MELQRNLCWHRLYFGIAQVCVGNNDIDECVLGKFVGSVCQSFDVDCDIIGWVTLVFHVEADVAQFIDNAIKLLIRFSNKGSVVNVHNECDVVMIENAFINQRLLEADGMQFVDKMFVPNSTGLLLTIEIVPKLQNMVSGVSMACFNTIWKLHIHVYFTGRLWVCHDKINLLCNKQKKITMTMRSRTVNHVTTGT